MWRQLHWHLLYCQSHFYSARLYLNAIVRPRVKQFLWLFACRLCLGRLHQPSTERGCLVSMAHFLQSCRLRLLRSLHAHHVDWLMSSHCAIQCSSSICLRVVVYLSSLAASHGSWSLCSISDLLMGLALCSDQDRCQKFRSHSFASSLQVSEFHQSESFTPRWCCD